MSHTKESEEESESTIFLDSLAWKDAFEVDSRTFVTKGRGNPRTLR